MSGARFTVITGPLVPPRGAVDRGLGYQLGYSEGVLRVATVFGVVSVEQSAVKLAPLMYPTGFARGYARGFAEMSYSLMDVLSRYAEA